MELTYHFVSMLISTASLCKLTHPRFHINKELRYGYSQEFRQKLE